MPTKRVPGRPLPSRAADPIQANYDRYMNLTIFVCIVIMAPVRVVLRLLLPLAVFIF